MRMLTPKLAFYEDPYSRNNSSMKKYLEGPQNCMPESHLSFKVLRLSELFMLYIK